MEVHRKLNEYRQKGVQAYYATKYYLSQKEGYVLSHVNSAVCDSLNESKRANKDFMEKLSSGCPTPSNKSNSLAREQSLSNSQK